MADKDTVFSRESWANGVAPDYFYVSGKGFFDKNNSRVDEKVILSHCESSPLVVECSSSRMRALVEFFEPMPTDLLPEDVLPAIMSKYRDAFEKSLDNVSGSTTELRLVVTRAIKSAQEGALNTLEAECKNYRVRVQSALADTVRCVFDSYAGSKSVVVVKKVGQPVTSKDMHALVLLHDFLRVPREDSIRLSVLVAATYEVLRYSEGFDSPDFVDLRRSGDSIFVFPRYLEVAKLETVRGSREVPFNHIRSLEDVFK
ncbi:hypothetical protein HY486_03895 [Candidatus Woesearchaeota archaeon]|nr:hypothetical protein [Candidatus Woesearchaeota archaeon]